MVVVVKPFVVGAFCVMNKVCKSCNIEKPHTDFEYCKGGVFNVAGTCKKCKKLNNGFCINNISDLDGEIWIPIRNWEQYYMVSNKSRIKRLPRKFIDISGREQNLREKIMKTPICTTTGYQMIDLEVMDKLEKNTVHRIVGLHFIENPENKPEINHKNGIRHDNRIENLEWATSSEQKLHSFRVLGRKLPKPFLGKKGKLHPTSKPINQIDFKTGVFIKTFESGKQAIEQGFATDSKNLWLCCNGINNKHNGFKWEYA